jgi:hypothetical protein
MKNACLYLMILLAVCGSAVGNNQIADINKPVTINPNGDSVLEGKVDGKTIRVVLSTNKIDIGGSDQTPPQVRKTSCTYSKFPCSQISNLNISVNGKKLFVPRSVFADRTDVGTMNLSGADGINVITLVGGDASEGYTVKVFFDGRRVKKRELYSNEANSLDEATTYFRPVVLN